MGDYLGTKALNNLSG